MRSESQSENAFAWDTELSLRMPGNCALGRNTQASGKITILCRFGRRGGQLPAPVYRPANPRNPDVRESLNACRYTSASSEPLPLYAVLAR